MCFSIFCKAANQNSDSCKENKHSKNQQHILIFTKFIIRSDFKYESTKVVIQTLAIIIIQTFTAPQEESNFNKV
jgi:hypothetical protein